MATLGERQPRPLPIPRRGCSARHCIDVARDDSIRLRRATIADAGPLARGVIEGVEDYSSFAPPGWTAPSFEAELKHLREALAEPDVCCLMAESDGALVGQITLMPAARAPHPVEDSSLAHISASSFAAISGASGWLPTPSRGP